MIHFRWWSCWCTLTSRAQKPASFYLLIWFPPSHLFRTTGIRLCCLLQISQISNIVLNFATVRFPRSLVALRGSPEPGGLLERRLSEDFCCCSSRTFPPRKRLVGRPLARAPAAPARDRPPSAKTRLGAEPPRAGGAASPDTCWLDAALNIPV